MNFFLRLITLIFCSLFSINSTWAAISTASMLIGVDVVGDCTIGATPLLFGIYSPNSRTSNDSSARLRVLCTLNRPYQVALDQGAGNGATTRFRRMSGPRHSSIKYILTQNPSHTINWGNVIGVDTKLRIGTGLPQTLVVYGQIPPQQNVEIGSYRDFVNVSIIF